MPRRGPGSFRWGIRVNLIYMAAMVYTVPMSDDEYITVVSGLPRSGTSLMMNMLEKGGLVPLTDHLRKPDEDNPRGYYEFERVKKLPDDTGWLPEAKGKVVKILAELVKYLPPGYRYRMVFMMRNIDEIIASQRKMMERRGEGPDDSSDEEMAALLRRYLKMLKQEVNSREDTEVCYISYNDLMTDPDPCMDELLEFFDGKLDRTRMREAIDARLYRNRA